MWSHLSLRDPTLDLASLSEPVTKVMEGTAAEALGAKVTELVEAFLQATATAAQRWRPVMMRLVMRDLLLFRERSASASGRRKNFV